MCIKIFIASHLINFRRLMFESWLTVLYSVWSVTLAFLTYIGLVELIKLKLKCMFLLVIGLWIYFTFSLTSSLELFHGTISCALGGLAIVTILISAFVGYREHDRASSIYQLLKKLPLRDRLLRRIPESLLQEPLPPPIPPPISFKLGVALALILSAAIGSIVYGYMFSLMASWTIPLLPAIYANWCFIFFLRGIFLFVAAVLIMEKHQRIGSIITLFFSAVTIFSGGPIGIFLGVIGILGGILAFTGK